MNFIYRKWISLRGVDVSISLGAELFEALNKDLNQAETYKLFLYSMIILQIPTYTENSTQYLHDRNAMFTSFVLNHIQIKYLRTKKKQTNITDYSPYNLQWKGRGWVLCEYLYIDLSGFTFHRLL